MEADVVCGLLRSTGIECGHRVTEGRWMNEREEPIAPPLLCITAS
jgi:hypothetical protein